MMLFPSSISVKAYPETMNYALLAMVSISFSGIFNPNAFDRLQKGISVHEKVFENRIQINVFLNFILGEKTEIVSRVWGEPQREGDNLVYHFSYIPLIEGVPILRWMGIRTNGEEKVYARPHIASDWDTTGEESGKDLIIELKLDSKIEVFDGREWRTDYLGPNRLDVDLSVLKERRKELGFTQAHVAEAVGVELRTYQKWERNEKEGIKGVKGISLVRLMHYLGFDLYDVIKDVNGEKEEENNG